MYKYDEAMDAFAADAAAIVGWLAADGGCRKCLDTGLLYAGHDHMGRTYDPCDACEESTEDDREERDAFRQDDWPTADYALLLTLRQA